VGEWFIYMIEATDGSLYTGITRDVARRWREHAAGKRGARFFRGRAPSRLAYLESSCNRSTATRRELAIKALTREQKLALIGSGENQLERYDIDIDTGEQ
jgi:putative endonuclease